MANVPRIELTRRKAAEARAQSLAVCGSTQMTTKLKLGHPELFVEGAQDLRRPNYPQGESCF
jgi:hypothetical protein